MVEELESFSFVAQKIQMVRWQWAHGGYILGSVSLQIWSVLDKGWSWQGLFQLAFGIPLPLGLWCAPASTIGPLPPSLRLTYWPLSNCWWWGSPTPWPPSWQLSVWTRTVIWLSLAILLRSRMQPYNIILILSENVGKKMTPRWGWPHPFSSWKTACGHGEQKA